MKTQPANPTCKSHVRPEDLRSEIGIKTNTYYRDLNFLNIEGIKDEEGKIWITKDDAERIKALRMHVQETGKRQGFYDNGTIINENEGDDSAINEQENQRENGECRMENSENNSALITSEEEQLVNDNQSLVTDDGDIYVEPEEPTDNINVDNLVRDAAELKAREIAMPELVKRAIADKLTEDELPLDLKEKINLAREAANPKFTPDMVATSILARYRQQKAG